MSKETNILTIFNKGSASYSTESHAVNDWLKNVFTLLHENE